MTIENKELFHGKYRILSARCPSWDYSSYGYYFVTICTKNRQEFFGEIRNGIMRLNEIGCMTAHYWQNIPNHFKNVVLDEWVVMPNHVHGIIFLMPHKNRIVGRGRGAVVGDTVVGDTVVGDTVVGRDVINHVSTIGKKPPINQKSGGITGNKQPMMNQGSLSEIIRWYKGRVSFEIHENLSSDFAWQPRYHDHIIRNESSLNRIRQYIRNNPAKWYRDRNNPEYDLFR